MDEIYLETLMHKTPKCPLVSIGFLSYNGLTLVGKKVFIEALETWIQQSYPNKEILILDDCSTDGTFELCQKYAQKYDCIKFYRNEKNLGALRNLEQGFDKVSGDFFLWASQDDTYHPSFISKCIKEFMKSPESIIVCTAIRFSDTIGNINYVKYHDFFKNLPFRKLVRNSLRDIDSCGEYRHYSPLIHSSLVRANYLARLFSIEQSYVAEEAWFLNALIWGKISYIDEFLYYRFDPATSFAERHPNIVFFLNDKFGFFKNTFLYVGHFMKDPTICWSKKLKYIFLGWLILRYRAFPRAKRDFKFLLFNIFIKLKLVRYGDR